MKKIILSLVMLLLTFSLCGCEKNAGNIGNITGTAGGKTTYQDVKTEVVELSVTFSSDMPPVTYSFLKDGEETFFKKEDFKEALSFESIDAEIFNKLNGWVDEYNIKKWDGFNKRDEDGRDGSGFNLSITLATGEKITAAGYMVFPEGYQEAKSALLEICNEAGWK